MSCTICQHPQRQEIDRALVAGSATLAALSQQYQLSTSALHRHKAHLQAKVGRAKAQLQDNLLQDTVTRQVRVVQAGIGQAASLDYQVVSQRPEINRALLAIRLHTGRGHQIRVQLASRGWPIVNDSRYGPGSNTDRQADIALLAAGLGFSHPISRQWLQFTACPPQKEPWTAFPAVDFSDVFKYFSDPV